jgi:hypothetical protein
MEPSKMKFTGTLIEDLMATVELAEKRVQSGALLGESMLGEPMLVESSAIEPSVEAWFTSVHESADCDSKLMGVA